MTRSLKSDDNSSPSPHPPSPHQSTLGLAPLAHRELSGSVIPMLAWVASWENHSGLFLCPPATNPHVPLWDLVLLLFALSRSIFTFAVIPTANSSHRTAWNLASPHTGIAIQALPQVPIFRTIQCANRRRHVQYVARESALHMKLRITGHEQSTPGSQCVSLKASCVALPSPCGASSRLHGSKAVTDLNISWQNSQGQARGANKMHNTAECNIIYQ